MKKKMNVREIILFVILAVLLLFYFLNKGPLERWQESAESERDEVQGEIELLQPYIKQMNIWDKELDAIYAKYGGNPKSIPDYPNVTNIMYEMSNIFDDSNSYTISFSDPVFKDHIVTRTIRITFSCDDYDIVKNKIDRINESENRYRIGDLSISASGSSYSVTLEVVAYEYSNADE